MIAGNMRRISTYGGVGIYVEDEDEQFAEAYMEELLSEWNFLHDEGFEDKKRGPPEVDEATLQLRIKLQQWERLMDLEKWMSSRATTPTQEMSCFWTPDKCLIGGTGTESGEKVSISGTWV